MVLLVIGEAVIFFLTPRPSKSLTRASAIMERVCIFYEGKGAGSVGLSVVLIESNRRTLNKRLNKRKDGNGAVPRGELQK